MTQQEWERFASGPNIEEIARKVAESLNYDGIRNVLLVFGPVRSATTGAERMAVASGRPATYQPVKAILRQIAAGQEPNRINLLEEAKKIVEQYPPLNGANPSHIAVKETVGLKTESESDMPYFQLHRELAASAGAELSVLLTARHPASAYASCTRTYGEAINDDDLFNKLFIRSQLRFYQQVEQVQEARDLKHVLVAHAFLNTSDKPLNYAEILAHNIFNCLDIPIPEGAPPLSYRWSSLSPKDGYNPALSGIYFPQEPGMTLLNEIAHKRVMESTNLGIGPGDVNGATLEIEGYARECAWISELYGNFYQESSKQLGFD